MSQYLILTELKNHYYNNNNEKVFVFPKQRVFYFLLSYCWKELNSDNYRGSIVDMFHSLFDSWSSVFSLHVFSRGFFMLLREEWTSRFNTLNSHSMRSRSSFCQFTLTYTSAPVRACNSQVHLDCLRCDSRTWGLTMKRTCWQRFILSSWLSTFYYDKSSWLKRDPTIWAMILIILDCPLLDGLLGWCRDDLSNLFIHLSITKHKTDFFFIQFHLPPFHHHHTPFSYLYIDHLDLYLFSHYYPLTTTNNTSRSSFFIIMILW